MESHVKQPNNKMGIFRCLRLEIHDASTTKKSRKVFGCLLWDPHV